MSLNSLFAQHASGSKKENSPEVRAKEIDLKGHTAQFRSLYSSISAFLKGDRRKDSGFDKARLNHIIYTRLLEEQDASRLSVEELKIVKSWVADGVKMGRAIPTASPISETETVQARVDFLIEEKSKLEADSKN